MSFFVKDFVKDFFSSNTYQVKRIVENLALQMHKRINTFFTEITKHIFGLHPGKPDESPGERTVYAWLSLAPLSPRFASECDDSSQTARRTSGPRRTQGRLKCPISISRAYI